MKVIQKISGFSSTILYLLLVSGCTFVVSDGNGNGVAGSSDNIDWAMIIIVCLVVLFLIGLLMGVTGLVLYYQQRKAVEKLDSDLKAGKITKEQYDVQRAKYKLIK